MPYRDAKDGESINATSGILVTTVKHAVTEPHGVIPSLDTPLYVVEASGEINGGGTRSEVLLLRPNVAAQLFVGNVIAAMRSGSVDLFERELSRQMREATGERANVRVIDLSKLHLN